MINQILVKIFRVPANFYYDDKFGIERQSTIDSADDSVTLLHRILGCDFEDRKHYKGRKLTILGVTYDLVRLRLEIKESR